MAAKPTFNQAQRVVKIVPTINNVPLANAKNGELYYDAATNRLYLRTSEGWHYVAFT